MYLKKKSNIFRTGKEKKIADAIACRWIVLVLAGCIRYLSLNHAHPNGLYRVINSELLPFNWNENFQYIFPSQSRSAYSDTLSELWVFCLLLIESYSLVIRQINGIRVSQQLSCLLVQYCDLAHIVTCTQLYFSIWGSLKLFTYSSYICNHFVGVIVDFFSFALHRP